MLTIKIPKTEIFDERTNTFSVVHEQELRLEHSLLSISKWESKWHKPFLSQKQNDKTDEEIIDYIRCMTITQNVDPSVYFGIGQEELDRIVAYIEDPMTATTITDHSKNNNREVITSEVIYYWMVTFGIPMECQKWHLNRLLTLIKVCNIKNAPAKKMSNREIWKQNEELNRQRRAMLHSKG